MAIGLTMLVFQNDDQSGQWPDLPLGLNQFINLAMFTKPIQVALVGMLDDVMKKVDGLGFVTWLAWIVLWHDHFDFHGHDISTTLQQPRSLQTFASNMHHMNARHWA